MMANNTLFTFSLLCPAEREEAQRVFVGVWHPARINSQKADTLHIQGDVCLLLLLTNQNFSQVLPLLLFRYLLLMLPLFLPPSPLSLP